MNELNPITQLPEHWAVQRTSETADNINEWINSHYKYGGCFEMRSMIALGIGGKFVNVVTELRGPFVLISYQQFIDWVYNPWKESQIKI